MFSIFSQFLLRINNFLFNVVVFVFVFLVLRVVLVEDILGEDWHPDVQVVDGVHGPGHTHPAQDGS